MASALTWRQELRRSFQSRCSSRWRRRSCSGCSPLRRCPQRRRLQPLSKKPLHLPRLVRAHCRAAAAASARRPLGSHLLLRRLQPAMPPALWSVAVPAAAAAAQLPGDAAPACLPMAAAAAAARQPPLACWQPQRQHAAAAPRCRHPAPAAGCVRRLRRRRRAPLHLQGPLGGCCRPLTPRPRLFCWLRQARASAAPRQGQQQRQRQRFRPVPIASQRRGGAHICRCATACPSHRLTRSHRRGFALPAAPPQRGGLAAVSCRAAA